MYNERVIFVANVAAIRRSALKSLKSLVLLVFCAMFALTCACQATRNTTDPSDIVDINKPDASPTPAQFSGPVVTGAVEGNEEPSPAATPDDGLPYYLYVEKGSFTLTIYTKDENGEYTVVYATYRIAHGGNKTPAGKFTLTEDRERWHAFPDGGTVQYATKYEGHLYIHSPLYATDDPTQLWPKYYDGEKGIGKESTGGCLRMVTEAAKFIYENCPPGTTLEIVNGSPSGTTSDDIPSRNGLRIDPTDYETLAANGY